MAEDYVRRYAEAILSGEIVACNKVITVYKNLLKTAENGSHGGRYYLDIEAGNRPIEFIETFCKQSKGTLGAPIKLELFQKAFIQALFGFKDRETGFRKFKEGILLVGRKNGKSTLASGIALYMLIADHEGSPEVDTVASKKDQARITFDESCNMADQSPHIKKLLHKRKTDLYCNFNYGTMRPLASDSNTLDGLNPSLAIIDELHAVKDRNLYDVIKQGQSARNQPMLLEITTAPVKTQAESIYDSQYEYASKVLSGEVHDETVLAVMYEMDNHEDWDKPDMWIQANPGIGTIKKESTLREFVEKAKNDPSFKNTVLSKDFNIKVSGSSSWLTWQQLWNPEKFDIEDIRDTYAIGGCDLSATTDLTCATLICKKPNDKKYYVLQQYFIPEARVKVVEAQESSKEAPYRKWQERGLLTICEGSRVDYSQVTSWFKKMRDEYQITMVWCGYDRALAGYWAEEMSDEFGQTVMEKIAQGPFTWSSPMKELGGRLSDKEFNYNANPVLAWCISNTAVKLSGTGDNIQPVKTSYNMRIDGLVSLLNAFCCYCNHKEDFENLVG